MLTITPEEKVKVCERCIYRLFGIAENHCKDCPLDRQGKRDRKAYFQDYYKRVTKEKRRMKRNGNEDTNT